jgi:hypothetical protein
MATAFADEAVRIHEVAHLSDAQIGRAVGAAPSTVRDWFARRSSPTGKRAERVAELAEIVDRLARVIEPDYIPVWLSKPIEALGDLGIAHFTEQGAEAPDSGGVEAM